MLDSITKWNSLILMVKRFLEIGNKIKKAKIDLKIKFDIYEDEISISKFFVEILYTLELAILKWLIS